MTQKFNHEAWQNFKNFIAKGQALSGLHHVHCECSYGLPRDCHAVALLLLVLVARALGIAKVVNALKHESHDRLEGAKGGP